MPKVKRKAKTVSKGKQPVQRAPAQRCTRCGYMLASLRGVGECPLCKPCQECGSTIRECKCIEGE